MYGWMIERSKEHTHPFMAAEAAPAAQLCSPFSPFLLIVSDRLPACLLCSVYLCAYSFYLFVCLSTSSIIHSFAGLFFGVAKPVPSTNPCSESFAAITAIAIHDDSGGDGDGDGDGDGEGDGDDDDDDSYP